MAAARTTVALLAFALAVAARAEPASVQSLFRRLASQEGGSAEKNCTLRVRETPVIFSP